MPEDRQIHRVRLVTDDRGWWMNFAVGETVVYPNHGAAVIEDIETRQIKGEDQKYLVLRIVAQNDLVVRVPACNLDLVGVRDVVDKIGLERVFGILRAEVASLQGQFGEAPLGRRDEGVGGRSRPLAPRA